MKGLPPTARVLRGALLWLLLLLPLLPVLRTLAPDLSFGEQSAVGLTKELVAVCAIAIVAIHAALAGRLSLETTTLLMAAFVGWAAIRTVVSLAPPIDAINGMRLAFLYPTLALAALLYVRNTGAALGVHPLDPTFFRLLLAQFLLVCAVGYVEYVQPLTRVFLYGERAGQLQTGVPGLADVRLVSCLENPINFGLYLCVALTLLFPRCNARRGWRRLGFWVLYLIALPLLVMTLSRVAYAIFAALTVFFVLRFRAGRGGGGAVGWALLGVLALAGLGALQSGRVDVDELVAPVVYRIESHLSVEAISEDPRVENWTSFGTFLTRDLSALALFGGGVGLSDPSGARGTFRVENAYMTLLGELGLPALALFVALLGRASWLAWRLARRTHGPERDLHLASLAFMAIFALAALTLDAHRNSPFSYYVWLVFLWIEAARRPMRAPRPAGAAASRPVPLASDA